MRKRFVAKMSGSPGCAAPIAALTAMFALVAAPAAWACDNDAQCKGDRVCEKGQCIAPAAKPAPEKDKPKPAPEKEKPKPKAKVEEQPTKPNAKPTVAEEEEEPAKPDPKPPADAELARRRTKEETSGLAIGAGFGYQTAGVGAVAAFYGHLGIVNLVPYAGVGKFPNEGLSPWGYALGLMVVLGDGRHRLVLDFGYGLAGVYTEQTFSVFGPSTKTERIVYGITGALGYEYMHSGGFFVRPSFGLTAPTTMQEKMSIALSIILGFKLW